MDIGFCLAGRAFGVVAFTEEGDVAAAVDFDALTMGLVLLSRLRSDVPQGGKPVASHPARSWR